MLNDQQSVNYISNIAGAVPISIEWCAGLASASEALCAPRQKFEIKVQKIAFDHTVFELKKPWPLDLYEADGVWYCSDEGNRFIARGATREEALHSLTEDFFVYWRVIAQAPDSELAPDAEEMKKFMHSLVRAIRTE
jgi:hypothetical protein